MSTIKVNTLTTRSGCTMTLGESGKTIALATGASQTGFGRTGTVNWDTTAKTASFTAVSGNGYFVNTTSGAITVTLPAGSAGDIVSLKDYANTWDTNNVTITPNGADKINGTNANANLNTEDQSVTLIYVDSTKGWRVVQDSTSSVDGATYVTATGGTITTSGDFKIHTFTAPGTFCVSSAGNLAGSNTVDYLVVAGGGSGGTSNGGGGGGGAGGFRLSNSTSMPAPLTSPLANPTGLTVTATAFPVTIGAGGASVTGPGPSPGGAQGNTGSNSIFSSITSAGGGGGGGSQSAGNGAGLTGGSGGGYGGQTSSPGTGGAGNTPPTSPPQGNKGGDATAPSNSGGGGGGAGAVGGNNSTSPISAGDGGIGSYVLATGFAGSNGTTGPVSSARYFAGGGGSNSEGQPACAQGDGGAGGGGAGAQTSAAGTAGTVNTGGGGGGNDAAPAGFGTGAGGSGIVIIRYKFQN